MARTRDPVREEQRRAQVVAAVQKLLVAVGAQSMTVEAIAREAGVSRGLINYYYSTKDELIVAAIRDYHAEESNRLLSIAREPETTLRSRLERLIELVFPSREAVMAEQSFQIEVRAYAKANPAVWEDVANSYRNFRSACEAMLKVGIEEGMVKKMSSQEISQVYLLFHSTVNGLLFQVFLDPNLDLADVRAQLLLHVERMLE